MKICLSFAAGGHFDQLMSLMDAFEEHEVFFVTVPSVTTNDLFKSKKTYYVRNGPKPTSTIFDWILLFFYYFYLIFPSLKILMKEKPDVLIGCGGEATLNLFYLGKILGKKLIYIESLARINDISLTGKLIYQICDLYLIQWKELLEKYPKAKYWGRVI